MKPFLDPILAEFQRLHPDIELSVRMSHGPPENRSALGEGVEELFQKNDDAFYRRHGYAPLNVMIAAGGRHVVGKIQALGVFVHPENPIKLLTLEQVEAIFSERPRGGRPATTKWGQLGLTGEWADRPIAVYGRERRQGASNFFRNRVLGGADYSSAYQDCPNSAQVIEAVKGDLGGIGYSALAYATPGVKALPLADREGARPGQPTEADVVALRYPLAYPLFISVNRRPGAVLDSSVLLFLRFVLSSEGQRIIEESGFLALAPEIARWELLKLE